MTNKESAEFQEKVAYYLRRHTELTYKQVSAELGISVPYLSKIAITHGLRRRESYTQFSLTNELLQKLQG
jgi:hypothetical protein